MHEPDLDRTKEDLVTELHALRARVVPLERSEALLRAVVEGIADPAYAKDERGRYTMVNPAAARLLRREPGEILGRHVRELLPPDPARRIEEGDARVMAEGESWTYVGVVGSADDMQTYLVTKAPYRDGQGRVAGVVGISRDITEVARQKEVLQTIFDHIPVMVCFVDPAGSIRLVNREWERVLGWSLEEARTLDIAAELYPDPERRREALEFILNPGRGWEEFRTRARDGRTIETAWSNVLLSDGTSIGFGLDIGDRKRAEEARSSSERQFRAVFEGALDAMIIADDDGRYVDANPAALAMFGLPREQLLARTVDEFAEPGFDAKGAWAAFRRSGSSQGSFRLVRPDGKVLETEFAAKADVLPGRHLSIIRDVTARIRAEGALRDSERRVVAILESITDGFYTLDSDWRFSYVNPQAEPILGKSRGELLGRVVWEEFPEALGTAFDHEYHRAVAERVPVAFEIEYPPLGGWFSVHAYPWADGLSVYFTDVTERHSAEEALRRGERRFRLVLENSRDVVYQLNLSTRTYDYASPSSLEVLGYSFDVLAAGGLARVVSSIHPEDIRRLEEHVARLLAPEPGSEFDTVLEYRMRVPGKGWRWMSDSGTVVRDEGGLPVAVVGSVRDVTDRRLAADRLRDLSRRLNRAEEEERRRIARELHDEIGQALTAIKLNVQRALRDPSSPAAARRLEEGIALVERTIGQVRDLSLDLRPSMLDDLGLVDSLRSYVSGFAERSGIRPDFVAEGEIGRLDSDLETACYRIAQEALTNVARHADAGRVRVELARSGPDVLLVVADDGSGFDVEAATARAAGGKSLGILGMQERATMVGGRLEIASGKGRGTEVRATFPAVEARPDPTGGPPGG